MDTTNTLSSDSGFNAMLASNSDADSTPIKSKNKPLSTSELRTDVDKSVKNFDELEVKKQKLDIPKPPELLPVPKAEDYQTDPMQKFGTAGMMIATLGALLTRRPLTNALKSAAAVNTAINEGDSTKFKTAMETWKVNNENAWKMADWTQTQYKDTLDLIDSGEKGAEEKLRLQAVAMQDPTMEQAIKTGTYRDLILTMQKKTQELKESSEKAQIEAGYKSQGIDDYKVANNGQMPKGAALSDILKAAKDRAEGTDVDFGKKQLATDQKAAYKEGYDKEFAISGDANKARLAAEKNMALATSTISGKSKEMSPEEYETWRLDAKNIGLADSWAEGSPISDLIRGRGGDAQGQLDGIEKLAYERHPNLDRAAVVQDYNAAKSALNKFGSGKQGDTVRSFNVAYAHADVLGSLIEALGNGDVQALNSARQRYEEEFGSPAPTNFDAVKGIFADEVNKAAVGGAGALGDREELRANISRYGSPEQLQGAVDTYKSLIVGQLQGTQRQYEQATGRKDFERFLSPEVKEDVKRKSKSTLKTYSPTEYKKAIDSGTLKSGDSFLDDQGVEHKVD